jgi:hypothetical protein
MTIKSIGQSFPQWGKLTKGNYTVGYKDTVFFKTDEQFSYYNYKNTKPFFVSIWYPAIDNKKIQFIQFKNYLEFPRQDKYGNLYDSLIATFHHILINDGVIKPLGEEVKFDTNHNKLYQSILNTKVNAKRNLVKINNKFPCIFYHHGAQSAPYDNNVFCEYMASHGFVVVSSNYNLPSASGSHELTVSTDERFDNISDMEFVLKSTKLMSNVDTSKMIAVGHSWGAQTEIRYDNLTFQKSFKKIISLHTTIEDKPLDLAKEYWPEFNYIYENKCENSTTPVIFFAPFHVTSLFYTDTITGKETLFKIDTTAPKYTPFKFNTTTPYTFITVKHNVSHDGFISLGNLRFPYYKRYHLADRENIIRQQFYFEQIIEISEKIIKTTFNNTFSNEILNNKFFIIQESNKTSETH